MKFFIDTAKVEDIKKANDMGVICGVTTNPSLIAKEGRVFEEVIAEIASIVDGPFYYSISTSVSHFHNFPVSPAKISVPKGTAS